MNLQFVSFPKSGRSWIRYALAQLHIADKIHFHHDGFEYNDGNMPPLDFNLEKRLARYSNGDKIVYLHRDPRDVMVSLFYQVTGRFSDFFHFEGTISQFIRDPYFGAENLQEFRRQWTLICQANHALSISYEDCHRNIQDTLRKVVGHYNFDVSEEALLTTSKSASFDVMRMLEQSGQYRDSWLKLRNGSPKVRRGAVGGYVSEMSIEDTEYLNRVFLLGPRAS